MTTITVPRTDLTAEEVAAVLRDGLGADYHVLPGMAMGQLPSKARTRAVRTRSWSAPVTIARSRRR